MLSKKKLIEQIESFPDNFTIDELIDRLIFIEKIEKGIEQTKKNEIIAEKEIKKKVNQWFK